MSQNDFVIANGSGAAVRSDINSALQALASLSGGTSAPGTIYANQLWFDTTNDLLKIRDEANTAWVTLASLVGTTWIPYFSGAAIGNMSTLTYSAVAQAIIMSGKQLEFASANLASATTPNLSTGAANSYILTGTTTITGFTTGQAGTIYFVRYTGAGLTLTHNATSLICPTGASMSMATGDCMLLYALGSNNVAVIAYQRADGSSLGGAIASQAQMEAASSTTVSVSPGRFQYHPGATKWWVNADCTGTQAVRTSHNVTSLTDNGSGRCQVNVATDFSHADWSFRYGVNTSVVGNASTFGVQMRSTDATAMAAGTLEVQVGNTSSGSVSDADVLCLDGTGDQ
jgi:hypothetical protein